VGSNLFERLDKARPQPTPEETIKHEKTQSIELLLRWLTNSWPRDTITLRQLRIYGPNGLRHETEAILELAQDLCTRGWLCPLVPRRRDTRAWKIGHKSNSTQP
jgi:hypothetical protein